LIERWWMLRFPDGNVRMAKSQDGVEAGHEARKVGALAFAVVRLADYEEALETQLAEAAHIR
jgi:hypothetical protein